MKRNGAIAKPKSYGWFAIAAAVYTLGVAAFSVWSYVAQKKNLLQHVDRSLLTATYATEQILGPDFILSLTADSKNDFVENDSYADRKKRLDIFTAACDFDAAGAALHKAGKTRNLISGVTAGGIVSSDELLFKARLPKEISALTDELAASENGGNLIRNIHIPDYGTLRIAIRYIAVTPETGYALMVARNIDGVSHMLHREVMRKGLTGLFLLLMAFPLVALYSRSQMKASDQLAALNNRLKLDVENQKNREIELKDAIRDLERFNAVSVGRENRIIELKSEVNMLLKEMKRQKRYNVDQAD
jgi:hypothetical protein